MSEKLEAMERGVPTGAARAQPALIRYIDLPESKKTFAVSINHVHFDVQPADRIGVTRVDDANRRAPVTGRDIRRDAWC